MGCCSSVASAAVRCLHWLRLPVLQVLWLQLLLLLW
jgi:hypothetical protein